VSRLRRFENLERARPESRGRAAEHPALADRFGAARAEPAPEPAGSADEIPHRFEEGSPASTLRVRDIDDGQPFVRCALCRADGHVASLACSHCGADLTTPEQRVYNEALWRKQLAERAEEQEQVAKLEAARDAAEREAAEVHREFDEILRRHRRGARRGIDDATDTIRDGARSLGGLLGGWLRRAVPNRTYRIAVAVIAAAALAALVAAYPMQAWASVWAVLMVAIVIGWIRRAARFWGE
jgi:hypothetical protein